MKRLETASVNHEEIDTTSVNHKEIDTTSVNHEERTNIYLGKNREKRERDVKQDGGKRER